MLSMRSRLIEPELLDHASPEEARGNLVDIIRLNERFGGHDVIRKMLARRGAPTERFSVLDIGAASGDTARLITVTLSRSDRFQPRSQCRSISRTLLVRSCWAMRSSCLFVMALSILYSPHCSCTTSRTRKWSSCWERFIEYRDGRCLISDLERHILSYWFLPMTKPFLRWHPITVHDGPVSVRAAFTAQELRAPREQTRVFAVARWKRIARRSGCHWWRDDENVRRIIPLSRLLAVDRCSASHSGGPTWAKTFHAEGLVTQVDPGRHKITISHRDIPGFMPAMEMPFTADEKEDLQDDQAGRAGDVRRGGGQESNPRAKYPRGSDSHRYPAAALRRSRRLEHCRPGDSAGFLSRGAGWQHMRARAACADGWS